MEANNIMRKTYLLLQSVWDFLMSKTRPVKIEGDVEGIENARRLWREEYAKSVQELEAARRKGKLADIIDLSSKQFMDVINRDREDDSRPC